LFYPFRPAKETRHRGRIAQRGASKGWTIQYDLTPGAALDKCLKVTTAAAELEMVDAYCTSLDRVVKEYRVVGDNNGAL
jgi:hypothetical protein